MAAEVLSILHFNDVYNIEGFDREPVGGAARLAGLVKSMADRKPLVLFSGDCFNPSMMSTVTKGKQMVPILNEIGVKASVVGNHDLDWGLDNFIKLSKQCTFPWLLANIQDKKTGGMLGDAQPTAIIEWEGWRVGLVGLAEEEWLTTLSCVDLNQLHYSDFVSEARRYAQQLRAEGADVVVALTHMRAPNDELLLREVAEVDLVLGGHDHQYLCQHCEVHGNLLVKSGTDFKDLTLVELRRSDGEAGRKVQGSWTRVPVTSDAPSDPAVAELVAHFKGLLGAKMDKPLGRSLVDLDGRFSSVRTSETNLGNLVCDVWLHATQADVVLLNSGSLRSDMVHQAGELKVKDLVAILPMLDETVVLACTGAVLLKSLENGISQYPKLEGRFLQVAGIQFAFDPSKPPGQRVVEGSVKVGGAQLEPARTYRLATKAYLGEGRDGFDCLVACKRLVGPDIGVLLPTIIRNHFRALQVLSSIKKSDAVERAAHHWARFAKRRTHSDDGAPAATNSGPKVAGTCVLDPVTGQYAISPVVEGRITCVGSS